MSDELEDIVRLIATNSEERAKTINLIQEDEQLALLLESLPIDERIAVWNEIENASPDDGFVPARRVDIVNNRSAYIRLCEYALTDSEAATLRTDPRVLAVDRPVKDLPFVKIVDNAVTQENSFAIRSISNDDNVNWGLIRH